MPRRLGVTLDPRVFEDAAQHVEKHDEFCCSGISCACGKGEAEIFGAHYDFFEKLFKPPKKQMGDPELEIWWGVQGDTEPRILALLFAARIAKEGL
jgi:hypothetical protein